MCHGGLGEAQRMIEIVVLTVGEGRLSKKALSVNNSRGFGQRNTFRKHWDPYSLVREVNASRPTLD